MLDRGPEVELDLKTGEPAKDLEPILAAILADGTNLGLSKMAGASADSQLVSQYQHDRHDRESHTTEEIGADGYEAGEDSPELQANECHQGCHSAKDRCREHGGKAKHPQAGAREQIVQA